MYYLDILEVANSTRTRTGKKGDVYNARTSREKK